MRKRDELANLTSCLNKAAAFEWLFVILARDEAGPATVRFWVAERIRLGLNQATDTKMVEALEAADFMDQQRNSPELVEYRAKQGVPVVCEASREADTNLPDHMG